jgi:hypothetical protein
LIPDRVIGFSLFQHIHIGSGAHAASYSMSTGDLFLGVKWLGHEAYYSTPSTAEVTNVWSYTSTPSYIFITWCLIKHRGNFTIPYHIKMNY